MNAQITKQNNNFKMIAVILVFTISFSIFPLGNVLAFETAKPTAQALKTLPPEVANEIERVAMFASMHAATKSWGSGAKDAKRSEDAMKGYKQHFAALKQKSAGLGLSAKTIEQIKLIAWNAAWDCASDAHPTRHKNKAGHYAKTEQAYHLLYQDKNVSPELAGNIWDICQHAAYYYTAHEKKSKHAKHYRDQVLVYHANLKGKVNVVKVIMHTDAAKVLKTNPNYVGQHEFNNKSDFVQTPVFKQAYTTTETHQWNHKLGFEAGVKSEFGVEGDAKLYKVSAKMEVSFSVSQETSWGKEVSKTKELSYEFPVSCQPGKKTTLDVINHEVKMAVPYTIVYEVGGVTRTTSGVWHGTTYSKVTTTYDVQSLQ